MIYTPHDYQSEAIGFIVSHSVCCLCLDMGLGKTVCTLTALSQLMARGEVKKTLIVAPLRVAQNVWPAEVQKWDHLQELRCSLICGTAKQRRAALQADADLYIINRDNLSWLRKAIGTAAMFDALVIDEMSSFKNIASKRTQSMYFLRRPMRRVIALTGTPAPNGLVDLWSQYKILDDGACLGPTLQQYKRTFFRPGNSVGRQSNRLLLKNGAREEIGRRIAPITVSMKAGDHLDMPALYLSPLEVTLSEDEMDEYLEFKEDMILRLGQSLLTVKNALTHCGKLTQYANGTVYDEEGGMHAVHARKLDALEDLVEQANGKPVLVAYMYRHDCIRIQACLRAKGLTVRCLSTAEDISAWNAGEIDVGLISPAGAGFGLNLQQGSHTLIWYGLTWNLEQFLQTNARLWRQGQPSPFVVIRLIIAQDTIDEKILAVLMQKDRTQSALLDAVRAELRMPNEKTETPGAEMECPDAKTYSGSSAPEYEKVCENCRWCKEDGVAKRPSGVELGAGGAQDPRGDLCDEGAMHSRAAARRGEDCGTYHVCCRPGQPRSLTQPGESCSAFLLQPWLKKGTDENISGGNV